MNHKSYILGSINSLIVEEGRQILSTAFLEDIWFALPLEQWGWCFDEANLQVNEAQETYQDLQKFTSIRFNIAFTQRHFLPATAWLQFW